nr:hypothetical protein [Tanacetum cinerariifolium]
MVGSDIDGYTARFHELARLVPHMVTPESQRVNRYIRGLAPEIKAHVTSSQPATIQGANRNRGRDDRNKRQRTGSNFALTTPDQGQGQRQYAGQHLKCAKCNFHHSGNYHVCGRCKQVGHFTRYCRSRVVNERPRPACYECGDPNHSRRNYPRMNQATTARGNRPNPVLAIEGNPKPGNNRNRAQGRAFTLGVAEAPQDSNVVTSTFSLNDHFAIVLIDSGVDYSFISTNFLPLIDIKPSIINPGYEIEIASGIKVVTNMIVRCCRLELEGHTFIIDLIPFGHGSFDVIIGMDWLSNLRAKIVCFEKIVQIPLSNGDILEVHGERPEGNLKQLKTMKVNESKLKDIPVVRKFPDVFLEDLSGLPPFHEVEFRIDLIHGTMPVAKLPYRLAPTEMQELANQLKELQDKGFIRPSSSPWGAPLLFVKKRRMENAFQTLKDMLCDAPILALPEGADDFVVYCDASNQGKANVVADALSRKERVKPKRLRAMVMAIQFGVRGMILAAQSEALKQENVLAERLHGLDQQMESKEDESLYFIDNIWVLLVGGVRTIIMNEAHKTRYSVHPGANKMFQDLRDMYWWPKMKRDIANYVSKCLTCSKVKAEHQRPSGLLQQTCSKVKAEHQKPSGLLEQPEIPE